MASHAMPRSSHFGTYRIVGVNHEFLTSVSLRAPGSKVALCEVEAGRGTVERESCGYDGGVSSSTAGGRTSQGASYGCRNRCEDLLRIIQDGCVGWRVSNPASQCDAREGPFGSAAIPSAGGAAMRHTIPDS